MAAIVDAEAGGRGSLPARDADLDSEKQHAPIENASSNASAIVVCFEENDPTNPYNWSAGKKIYILVVGMVIIMNSTLGSALPSGAASYIGRDFGIKASAQLTLPITAYLIGYVLGPLLFGPLSEARGRRPVMIWTFMLFTIFTIACAVAPNFGALVVFRLFTGIFAAAPTAVIGGLYADIYATPLARGRAMAGFMACTTLGPTCGPVISGFVTTVGWRWVFWVASIFAGVSIPPLLCMPETYGPIILLHKAQNLRKASPSQNFIATIELEVTNWQDIATRVLTRPIQMLVKESVVLFSCLYLSLAYSIFYLFFEAYPIIFQGIYGMSNGVAGLAFISIGVGALLSFLVFLQWDSILRRAQSRNRPWAAKEEYRRLPLACIGGPLYASGIFWLGWTARASIHPIVPILAGLPFGIGFLLIFMALINYLADAYEVFAASALAAASCTRSVTGAVLPLAAGPMFARLGVAWAMSLLGFASLVMAAVPWGFLKWGDYLREHSKFSLALKELKKKREEAATPRTQDGE